MEKRIIVEAISNDGKIEVIDRSMQIAILFNGDLAHSRQGLVNSAILRAKYLRMARAFDIDIFCIHEYDSRLLRILRRTPKPSFQEEFIIEDQKIKVIYRRNSLFDFLYHRFFHKKSSPFVTLAYKKISKVLKDYDMICAHSTIGGLIAQETKNRYGIPYNVTWHGTDIHTQPFYSTNDRNMIGSIIRNADSNNFVSFALLNTAMQIFKNIPNQHVTYNAPNDCFHRYNDPKRELIRKTNTVLGCKVVAFVGNLVGIKNVFTLPTIFAKVQRECSDTIFWIVGDGYCRKKLESDFSDKNLTCKFWGNRQPEEMPDIMNCIDVLVLPSKNESFGMVLVEAMACGANAVGSNVGGIPEVIGSTNSFDLDVDFTDNISSRIVEMLTHKVIQNVNPEFDWNRTAQMETIYFTDIIKSNK